MGGLRLSFLIVAAVFLSGAAAMIPMALTGADALESSSDTRRGGSLAAALGVAAVAAVETRPDGTEVRRYVVRNAATVHYLERLWDRRSCDDEEEDDGAEETVTINVGVARRKNSQEAERMLRRGLAMIRQRRLRQSRQAAQHRAGIDDVFELDWLSHVFYVLSPLLTVTAATLMVLLSDYWGLAFILSLMLSRLLNIYTIRKRSRPVPDADTTVPEDRLTEYVIALGPRRRVVLRGRADDLQALTTRAWLRRKTPLDGYCEAASKLIVYMVAALSGNLTQAGALVLMTLLLLSAGLLGLSNAHLGGFQVHGRVAREEQQQRQKRGKAVVGKDSLDLEQGWRDGQPVEEGPGR